MTEFIVNPVAKPRMTRRDVWAHRGCVDHYYVYKDLLVFATKKKKFILPDSFKVEFFMPMPFTWSEKKKLLMLGKPHQQRPDLDNLVKGLLDALRSEDKYIWHVDASKIWWEEGKIIIYDIKEL
jgi:Holliday junction resolvase RusA-like endonuclease